MFAFLPQGSPEPERLGDLAEYVQFELRDPIMKHPVVARGFVLKQVFESRTRVFVEKFGKELQVEFVDAGGKKHMFKSSGAREEDWAPGSLVYPVINQSADGVDAMEENTTNTVSLKPSAAGPSGKATPEQLKARVAAKAKLREKNEKDKAKAAAKVPREKKEKVLVPCGDGCGEMVARAFKPGHDSRLFSMLAKVAKNEMKIKDLPTEVGKKYRTMDLITEALAHHNKKRG